MNSEHVYCAERDRLIEEGQKALVRLAELETIRLEEVSSGSENFESIVDSQIEEFMALVNRIVEALRQHREGHRC